MGQLSHLKSKRNPPGNQYFSLDTERRILSYNFSKNQSNWSLLFGDASDIFVICVKNGLSELTSNNEAEY